MPNWTEQQNEAICDRGHNLIVCAAAGSGKTAVLVERIVRLIREGTPVESFLVVTFTNAAAVEMRQRIGDTLAAEAEQDPALAEQLNALPNASISTLHHFCGLVLREHFQAAETDPGFRIIDGQESAVLEDRCLDEALDACYEERDPAFMTADECFGDEKLAGYALQVTRAMLSRPDPEEWLKKAEETADCTEEKLKDSPILQEILDGCREELEKLEDKCRRALELCRRPGAPAYENAIEDDLILFGDLKQACDTGYGTLQKALQGLVFMKLSPKKVPDLDEELKAEIVKLRTDYKKKAAGLLGDKPLSLERQAEDIAMTAVPLRGLLHLVRKFRELYTEEKKRKNVLDFSDLEHLTLKALEKEEVREALRNRYRYVFIDEYQDSSELQERIVSAFVRPDGRFLVGDVKQSIYRFRQAKPELFLDRAREYDRAEETLSRRIDLQNNFRSRENILSAVNAVFSRIMKGSLTEIEYDSREALICGRESLDEDPAVELHLVGDLQEEDAAAEEAEDAEEGDGEEEQREAGKAEREALIAAERIHSLMESGTKIYDKELDAERPLTYRDFAVLMRRAKGCASKTADVLRAQGIPVYSDTGSAYFEIREIRRMMALLQTVSGGIHDVALIASLKGPALGLSDDELAMIRIRCRGRETSYTEAVRRYAEEGDDALSEKLRGFMEKIRRWRLCARYQGVDRLIERIYSETDFLAQAGAMPGGREKQANLRLLASRAREYMINQHGSLAGFLRYAEKLRAESDSTTAAVIGESENVVRLMTVHKSKGLEFPVVILMDMGRKITGKKNKDGIPMSTEMGIGLPCVDLTLRTSRETLQRSAILKKEQRASLSEEIRILYVGMTRARERLILIGTENPKDLQKAEGRKDSAKITEIKTELEMLLPVLSDAGVTSAGGRCAFECDGSKWELFPHAAKAVLEDTEHTDEKAERLLEELSSVPVTDEELRSRLLFKPESGGRRVRKTSVTGLIRDEKTKEQERRDYHLTKPQRRPRFLMEKSLTAAEVGTAFHKMMQLVSLDALRESGNIAEEIAVQRARMLEKGIVTEAEDKAVPQQMMVRFFTQPLGRRLLASPKVHREWGFVWKRPAENGEGFRMVQGIIDLCFMENGNWILVDYKTDSPKDPDAVREEYRPQLAIYAQALLALTGIPAAESMLYLVRAQEGQNVLPL